MADDPVMELDPQGEEEEAALLSKPMRTVDDAINAIGLGRAHYRMLFICGVGSFAEALETANLSILFPVLTSYWNLTHYHLAALSSFMFIGFGLGSLFLGRLSDRIGRRKIFLFTLLWSSLMGLASALAPDIYTFIAMRLLLGIGYGGNLVLEFVLLAELVPSKSRGRFLSVTDLFYAVGSICSVLLAWLIIPSLGYRYLLAISAIPPFIVFLFGQSLLESPHYLAHQNREAEAKQVLMSLAEENKCSETVKRQIKELKLDSTESVEARTPDAFSFMLHERLIRVTLTMLAVWFFNSFASCLYIWLPLYVKESPTLNHGADSPMSDAYAAALALAVGELIGALILTWIVQLIDRRHLLAGGLIVLCFGSLVMGFMTNASAILWTLPAISGIKAGVLLLLYVLTPELYPTSIRSTSLGFFSAFQRIAPVIGHWLVAYLMSFSFVAVTGFFAGTYLIAAVCAMTLPFDTRQSNLAEHFYADFIKAQAQSGDKDSARSQKEVDGKLQ